MSRACTVIKAVNEACILNNIKDVYEGFFSTGIQRLTEFLKFENFQYVYIQCVGVKKSYTTGNNSALHSCVDSNLPNLDLSEIHTTLRLVSDNVKQINTQIAELLKQS